MTTKMTAERRLKKVVIDLMRNAKFADWSGVLMLGKKTVRDDVPTACTNGRDEMYGRAFVDGLDDKELAFVVLHEAAHKMLRQLFVWKKLADENPKLCNIAADFVVNIMIQKRDPEEQYVAMPRDKQTGQPMGCIDIKYDNWNTKQVYDDLKQQAQSGKGGKGGEGGEGFDDHDWAGAKELTEAEKAELEQEIDRAVRQGQIAAQKMHGKGAGDMDRELADLLTPKIDWREQLAEFVRSTCNAKDASSWRKVNRRFIGNDIYLPSLIGECVKRVVVACDTSGSIGAEEHARNMTETHTILQTVHPDIVDVIYWDHAVAAHEVYNQATGDDYRNSTRPRGGGGTNVECVSTYLKEKRLDADCIIVFTDGAVPNWGSDWQAPVLWVIVGGYGAGIYADNGKTIHIDDN